VEKGCWQPLNQTESIHSLPFWDEVVKEIAAEHPELKRKMLEHSLANGSELVDPSRNRRGFM
jgi:hypothetical protein